MLKIYRLFAVHTVYLPLISKELESFRQGWNNHKLSTENNRTPHQLWLNGILENIHSNSKPIENLQTTVQSRLDTQLRNYGLNLEDFQERLVVHGEIITPRHKEEITVSLTKYFSNEKKYLPFIPD
ncbi:hypothetical protein KUTeg_021909 [Tegillarca granosa]|uniref:Integrase core domain-containing protein n=1 Tax=Tegillarca granosa TaxID=220873 RepID=A0ABQ9EA91_TEGGR|nr:hypothetical protein KUTeg_021909 [Tegillarca granosa]